jgi:hypothetical protein
MMIFPSASVVRHDVLASDLRRVALAFLGTATAATHMSPEKHGLDPGAMRCSHSSFSAIARTGRRQRTGTGVIHPFPCVSALR